ncbi:hypothetical protein niasHT_039727 [Heterodera trifolii]|uniref:Uncharacterized protein n=1 Tax=Heterodera trifolii TaxID=157864 RepID=A0ABD2IU74_9BILA
MCVGKNNKNVNPKDEGPRKRGFSDRRTTKLRISTPEEIPENGGPVVHSPPITASPMLDPPPLYLSVRMGAPMIRLLDDSSTQPKSDDSSTQPKSDDSSTQPKSDDSSTQPKSDDSSTKQKSNDSSTKRFVYSAKK